MTKKRTQEEMTKDFIETIKKHPLILGDPKNWDLTDIFRLKGYEILEQPYKDEVPLEHRINFLFHTIMKYPTENDQHTPLQKLYLILKMFSLYFDYAPRDNHLRRFIEYDKEEKD